MSKLMPLVLTSALLQGMDYGREPRRQSKGPVKHRADADKKHKRKVSQSSKRRNRK